MKVIKLQFPVEYEKDGIKHAISEVCISRPKAKHLKCLPKSDTGKYSASEILPFIAGISGLSEEAIEEIDLNDLGDIVEVAMSFLSKFQKA